MQPLVSSCLYFLSSSLRGINLIPTVSSLATSSFFYQPARSLSLCQMSSDVMSESSGGSVPIYTRPSTRLSYTPPSWCHDTLLHHPKHGRLQLANLPTPLYEIDTSKSTNGGILSKLHDLDITFLVKRDDASGAVELGGNKVRKLEFLLAEALANGNDSVVTIGGDQSNHCRATAAACRMVGLEPHLILRSRKADNDLGLVGNLLMDRAVGSQIYTCTPGEYGRVGSVEMIARLCQYLETKQKRRPYAIPVGGSNALGTWGYIQGVDELLSQLDQVNGKVDHIVFACGSGGTAAGIATGIALAYAAKQNNKTIPKVHGIGVCDNPDYFYAFVAGIVQDMGLVLPDGTSSVEDFIRQHLIVHQGKGLGYAMSTKEELEFVSSFARDTGIVLDPVYSGKAFYNFMLQLVDEQPNDFRGKTILFWHTGGALGLYDKCHDMETDLVQSSPCTRIDIYNKGNGLDLSSPTS